MRFLLTGIAGFVGRNLARHLLARGDEVCGTYLDERPEIPGLGASALYEADLLDGPGLARVVGAADPEAIVNLAGLSHVVESWQRMSDYFRVNVLGTENLLLAAAGGRRVVVASSAEVY